MLVVSFSMNGCKQKARNVPATKVELSINPLSSIFIGTVHNPVAKLESPSTVALPI
jgi:hypothetical protein